MERNAYSRNSANGTRAVAPTEGATNSDTTTPTPRPAARTTTRGSGVGHGARRGIVIDCDACVLRAIACGDCARTSVIGNGPRGAPRDIRRESRVELDADQYEELQVLISAGLLPPLRYRLPLAQAS
jgi:hypothetical protein